MSWLSLGTAALGALGGIFGGDDEEVTRQELPPYVESLNRDVFGGIEGAYNDRQQYIPYNAPRIAAPAPEYARSSDIIRNNVFAGLPALLQAQGIAQRVGGAPVDVNQVGIEAFSQDALNRFMSPYVDEVENRVVGGLENDFNRQRANLRQRNRYAGRTGGGRGDLQEYYQEENFTDTMADTRAKLRQTAYEQASRDFQSERDQALNAQRYNQSANLQGQQLGLQSQLQAAGLLNNLGNSTQQQILTGAGAISGVGDLWRGLSQQNLDQRYRDFIAQRDYPFTLATQALGAGQGARVPTTTTTVAPNNPITSGLGGGLVGLGLGNQLNNIFSDGTVTGSSGLDSFAGDQGTDRLF